MGAFEVTSLVGMIGGYVLVGVVWDRLGTGAFLLLPPLYGVAWLLVGPGGDQYAPGEDRGARDSSAAAERPSVVGVLRQLASLPGNVAFGISWLAINAIVGLWIQQAPFLLSLPERSATQALVGGFSGQQVGLIFAVWGAALLVGITLWSLLAPGMERRRAMSIALVGMLGVVASLAWYNHGGPAFVIWIAVALVLVEAGFTPAAFAHLAELTVPVDASRGAALGLYSVLLGAGQLLGNLLGGLFSARWQMDGVLGLTAMLAVVSLAGAMRMGTQSGKPQRQPAKPAR
jgi:MFS family permease